MWRKKCIHGIFLNGISLKQKHLLLVLLAALVLVSTPAQAQLSRLKFGKYKITSVVPASFRSVKGSAEVAVTNDTTSFLMKDISGVIYRNGEPFVKGTSSDIRVLHGASVISATGHVSLCDGVSVWNVIRCMVDFNPEEFTGNLTMTVIDAKGNRRLVKKEGLSVAEVLKNRKRKAARKP